MARYTPLRRMTPSFNAGRGPRPTLAVPKMPDLERAIRRESTKAKLDPALMASFDAFAVEPWNV